MIDIIIVNWNSGEYLAHCVNSLREFGGGYISKIIVVDNASTDSSLDQIASNHDIELVQLSYNAGFSSACNVGASKSDANFLLFLNPDAALREGCLAKTRSFMESDSEGVFGICGVQLTDENLRTHRHCARFPSLRTYWGHALALSYILPNFFPPHFMRGFDHLSSREVDQVIGAFFFVRRSVFSALSGFDERFFVYFEELDFSRRARQAGWRTYYLADAVAYHKGGGTSEQVKAHRLFYSIRSRLLYGFKHFSRTDASVLVFLSVVVEPLTRMVRALARLSGEELRNTFRGYVMLWRDLPNILRIARSLASADRLCHEAPDIKATHSP